MINCAVNQVVGKKISSRLWRRWLKEIGAIVKLPAVASISVALVDRSRMQQLNWVYRRKKQVTDVLSFAESDTRPIQRPKGQAKFLGEIIFCYPAVAQQAKKQHLTVETELRRLFVHGFLHLLGYDHQQFHQAKVMEALEAKILNQ